MSLGNAIVSKVLRSPMHRLLSRSTDLIRYSGRHSNRVFTTPTQYARDGDNVIVLVGRPATKTWWRNFETARDVEMLIAGRWIPMTAHAVVGANDTETITPLLDKYLRRFPKAARTLEGEDEEARAKHAVVVWCKPR